MTKCIIVVDDFLEDHIIDLMIEFYDSSAYIPDYDKLSKLDCGEWKPSNELVQHVWDAQNEQSMKIANAVVHWGDIYRWPVGSDMGLHNDVASKHTVFTSILYLNDDFEGGFTEFADGTRVAPKKGRIVFYDGIHYWHKVTPITKGIRYTFASWYRTNK